MIHICQDGTLTYRTREEPVFNGVAIPVFSTESIAQAKMLITLLGARQYEEHPKLPGQPWYRMASFAGTIEDLPRVTKLLQTCYDRLK